MAENATDGVKTLNSSISVAQLEFLALGGRINGVCPSELREWDAWARKVKYYATTTTTV